MGFKAINRDLDVQQLFVQDLFVRHFYGWLTLALNSWFLLWHNFEQGHIIFLKEGKNAISILHHLLNYLGLVTSEDLKAETKEKWTLSI